MIEPDGWHVQSIAGGSGFYKATSDADKKAIAEYSALPLAFTIRPFYFGAPECSRANTALNKVTPEVIGTSVTTMKRSSP